MQHNIKSLIGFTMGATDGEIGKVVEFYFDDESWTIRYLIVKTGGWLSERKVLISPMALMEPDWENESFPVKLSKDQIKHSPDIDTKMPVSRQQEVALYKYYEWPYGDPIGAGFYGHMGMLGMVESRVSFEQAIAAMRNDKEPGDPHLRSTTEVKGYRIHAIDGEIGHVTDFIVDKHWRIRFLVVDSGKWFPGKKLLISTEWITAISWARSRVEVDVSIEAVKSSPEYDPDRPIGDSYQTGLYRHYRK
ncbi:PRC-barrel domain-containing protein [Pedobacter sp. PLR]|uniref:PRC-barrel domain-containing protein n=1 Tax=Pedobacter sp. PLR TaxID=2994465 RepID=UPI0022463848|nr:PRC-barrel domain-containing protein [Pedobacter sp. PLR]MCX2454205.1 PRC-barrel domain-containing protein [Pedobacter sp. PLR]